MGQESGFPRIPIWPSPDDTPPLLPRFEDLLGFVGVFPDSKGWNGRPQGLMAATKGLNLTLQEGLRWKHLASLGKVPDAGNLWWHPYRDPIPRSSLLGGDLKPSISLL